MYHTCVWPRYSYHSNRNMPSTTTENPSTTLECNYYAVRALYFWIYNVFLDLIWYFCNHMVLMNYVAYRILFLASQMRIYSVPVTWNLVWHGLIKSHFVWGHNFAWKHLNRTKCLNVTISNQPMWIQAFWCLPQPVSLYSIIAYAGFQPSCLSSVSKSRGWYDSFLLHIVLSYLECCYAWVITSNAVCNHWKCYINF